MHRHALAALGLALVTQGCSVADTSGAEAEVTKFHALLGEARFAEIYAVADAELKAKASEQQFVELLDAVGRKLGKVKSAQRTGWKVNYSTSGNYVMLAYKTIYEQGEADEQFVYRMQRKEARLVGYHVNSNALITK